MDISINNNINFKALPIAKCGELNLYKITTKQDLKFLRSLPENIDLAKLMPDLTRDDAYRWQEMLEYAVDHAHYPGNTTYIETLGDRICGIVTYLPAKFAHLDCICTLPVEIGKRVKFAGKTLFYQVFNDLLKTKSKKMRLSAITNGPYDTVKKYESVGLSKTSNVTPTTIEMEINDIGIKNALKFLERMLNYEQYPAKNVNLSQIIDIQ